MMFVRKVLSDGWRYGNVRHVINAHRYNKFESPISPMHVEVNKA